MWHYRFNSLNKIDDQFKLDSFTSFPLLSMFNCWSSIEDQFMINWGSIYDQFMINWWPFYDQLSIFFFNTTYITIINVIYDTKNISFKSYMVCSQICRRKNWRYSYKRLHHAIRVRLAVSFPPRPTIIRQLSTLLALSYCIFFSRLSSFSID